DLLLDGLLEHDPPHGEGNSRGGEGGAQATLAPRLVDRLAGDVLGDDVCAAARGEVDGVGDVGGVDGDVHRAVAHAEDHDPLAAQLLGVGVVVRVHLAPVEPAGEGGLGPARIPVVAVGHEHGVVAARLAALELDLPDAVVPAGRV